MGTEGRAVGQDGVILHLPNKGNFVVAAFGFRIDPGADDAILFRVPQGIAQVFRMAGASVDYEQEDRQGREFGRRV